MEMSRKELLTEGATLVSDKIIQPAKEAATPYVAPVVEKVSEKAAPIIVKSKETAAPYIAKGKEVAAPYIAKGMETKEAVMKDERVQKAVENLKDKLAAVRERPADVARELGTNALDLIKYDQLVEYRDYVCSEQFVADTTKLVKEDLPTLAKDAAAKGQEKAQAAATVLKEELGHVSVIAKDAWKKGREEQPDLNSIVALRGLAVILVSELQAGLLGRVEANELDKTYAEMLARIKTVFNIMTTKLSIKGEDEAEETYDTAEEKDDEKDDEPEPEPEPEPEADEAEDAAEEKVTSM